MPLGVLCGVYVCVRCGDKLFVTCNQHELFMCAVKCGDKWNSIASAKCNLKFHGTNISREFLLAVSVGHHRVYSVCVCSLPLSWVMACACMYQVHGPGMVGYTYDHYRSTGTWPKIQSHGHLAHAAHHGLASHGVTKLRRFQRNRYHLRCDCVLALQQDALTHAKQYAIIMKNVTKYAIENTQMCNIKHKKHTKYNIMCNRKHKN